MANWNIVNRPKRFVRMHPDMVAIVRSDAPTMASLPKRKVLPPKDFAPDLITDLRAELASALRNCDSYAHHVAFYRWREAC